MYIDPAIVEEIRANFTCIQADITHMKAACDRIINYQPPRISKAPVSYRSPLASIAPVVIDKQVDPSIMATSDHNDDEYTQLLAGNSVSNHEDDEDEQSPLNYTDLSAVTRYYLKVETGDELSSLELRYEVAMPVACNTWGLVFQAHNMFDKMLRPHILYSLSVTTWVVDFVGLLLNHEGLHKLKPPILWHILADYSGIIGQQDILRSAEVNTLEKVQGPLETSRVWSIIVGSSEVLITSLLFTVITRNIRDANSSSAQCYTSLLVTNVSKIPCVSSSVHPVQWNSACNGALNAESSKIVVGVATCSLGCLLNLQAMTYAYMEKLLIVSVVIPSVVNLVTHCGQLISTQR